MDTRLLVIALPLLVAASWALFNIGRLAIQQIQRLGHVNFKTSNFQISVIFDFLNNLMYYQKRYLEIINNGCT
jgi:hypothetical protein